MAGQADGTTGPEPRPARRKKLIMIAAAVVFVGVGGFAALRFTAPAADATPEVATTPEPGEILEVAEMTTTLAGAQPHLARVTFSVQLNAQAVAAEVEPDLPLLRDAAVTELAESDADELMTPEGVDDLRARLLARAGEIYPDQQVLKVLVTELVVQ